VVVVVVVVVVGVVVVTQRPSAQECTALENAPNRILFTS